MVLSALIWIAWGVAPAIGQPLTTIVPRSPSDWHLLRTKGPVEAGVSVELQHASGEEPLWVFRADSPPGDLSTEAQYLLKFSDFGIPPVPINDADYWAWSWKVADAESSDYVEVDLALDNGKFFALAAAHTIYDYNKDVFKTPLRLLDVWTTLTEERRFQRQAGFEPIMDGTVVGIQVVLRAPHGQEVQLGPIQFGPPRDKEPPLAPRHEPHRLDEGGYFPVDLTGDGVAEVITPWMTGDKVWQFDREAFKYVRVHTRDILSRSRPFHLMTGADLDGDGDVDLVATDPDQRTIWRLTNRAFGFTADSMHVVLPSRATVITTLALADDDGDGCLELFLGYHLTGVPCVWRFPGQMGGAFGAPQPVLSSRRDPDLVGTYQVALADMNADGLLDIVTAAQRYGVHVLPGDGEGGYGPPVRVAHFVNAGFLRGIAIADVNGDGLLDFYVGNSWPPDSDPLKTRQNYLCLNHGGLIFVDAAGQAHVQGSGLTRDVAFAEVDGNPGPELVELTEGAINCYTVGRSDPARGDSPVTGSLAGSTPIEGEARHAFVQDLDGDGYGEAVLATKDGPVVVSLPNSGRVAILKVGTLGLNSSRVGSVVRSGAEVPWAVPIMATNNGGPMDIPVAANDRVRIVSSRRFASGAASDDSDGRTTVLGSVKRWWRWRRPMVWEYGVVAYRSPDVRVLLVALLVLPVAVFQVRRQRGRIARGRQDRWEELLRIMHLTRHAQWRQNLLAANRISTRAARTEARAPDPEEARGLLQKALPEAMLQGLGRAVDVASSLGIEGTGRARRHLAGLARVHGGSSTSMIDVASSAKGLQRALDLVVESLCERFSSNPAELVPKVVEGLSARGETPSCPVLWQSGGPYDGGRFPLASADVFSIIEEAVSNAVKKKTPPARITVSADRAGRRAQLCIRDDGGTLAAERARTDRPGSGSGLSGIQDRVGRLYHGEVELQDVPCGGVQVVVTVPDFGEG